jgi:hypothetical protein
VQVGVYGGIRPPIIFGRAEKSGDSRYNIHIFRQNLGINLFNLDSVNLSRFRKRWKCRSSKIRNMFFCFPPNNSVIKIIINHKNVYYNYYTSVKF